MTANSTVDLSGVTQGTLFEENYLQRTHKSLTSNPEVALTELVANAWDAGATRVDIVIPPDYNEVISITDNGSGMTFDEFSARWRKLSYNRLSHQGVKVEFPKGVSATRLAFGRNGIGRHGFLCFNDDYTVETKKQGKKWTIRVNSTEKDPINIVSSSEEDIGQEEHGVTIRTVLRRHRPDPKQMLSVLSARFVSDPNFSIYVNSEKVEPYDLMSGSGKKIGLKVGNIKLNILFIDTSATYKKSIYQGIAFWQAGRLVGEPSWSLNNESVLDGRTTSAKKFIFIVETNDLADFVNEDWTGFRRCSEMDAVYTGVRDCVVSTLAAYNRDHIEEIKAEIRQEHKREYEEASPLGRSQIEEVIEHITQTKPNVNKETIGIAVEAVAHVAQTRSGKELLGKLSKMDDGEIEALNKLLDKWSVNDALVVLDEIDKRLSVVELIRRLSQNKKVDELHTLHPLVSEAKWLFGPEFDTQEYTFNQQLRSIAKNIFKTTDASFINPALRPDLFVVDRGVISMTGLEDVADMSKVNKILIIELKKGGYKIGREERNQAQGYVEDILNSGLVPETVEINAFVVGDDINLKATSETTIASNGRIIPITYGRMVDVADRRLFRLRQKLYGRYEGEKDITKFQGVVPMTLPNLDEL